MIPLLLLAIAFGVGLATYEFSPRAHAWVDDHVRAIRGAIAAHGAADAHLAAAEAAAHPAIAADHASAASAANRDAARETATAATTARTEKERQAAAESAAKVVDREARIAIALAKLGVGQCGVRSYAHATLQIKNALLAKLHGEGMTVTGDNPWDIETHAFDVKLHAVWDPMAQVLKIIVRSGAGGYAGLVTCERIWDKIDPVLKEIFGP
jgi:hypothetical protein